MTAPKLHPRLVAWLAKRDVVISSITGRTAICTAKSDGSWFRLEFVRKRTVTPTRVTGTIDVGVDGEVFERITRGASVIVLHVQDCDALALATLDRLTVRTYDGDGGGARATQGGMRYWPVSQMRYVLADGALVDWDDAIAKRERGAVLKQREVDEAEVEEHEGQRSPEQHDIISLLNGDG